MERFYKYIEDIKSGEQLSCKWVKLAIDRHLKDIEKSKSDNYPYYFDEEESKKVINFAEICRHWKGAKAGQRIVLENHQVFYFGSIFGWRCKTDDTRRFRKSYKEVSRKAAKTTEAAIKSLYHILFDGEMGAQVYFVATKEEQARIAFTDAKNIILKTPELKPHFKQFTKSIIYQASTMKPLGSDSQTQDGLDPSWGVIDEYHAHKTDEMLNVIESGMGNRAQPFIDIITTAGFNSAGACFKLRKTLTEILEGTIQNDRIFAIIYTLDDEDDWKDESKWIKSNPNLNVSVSVEFMRTSLANAISEGGSKEVDFKTKNLNIWTDSAESWIPSENLRRNWGNFDIKDYYGSPCYAGLDLAKGTDINAFALEFEDGAIFTKFWIPESKVKTNKDQVDYQLWADKGFVEVMEGEIIDQTIIIDFINKSFENFNILGLGYDQYIAYHGIIQGFLKAGNELLTPIKQTIWNLSDATKDLETDLTAGKLKINNDVMKWMFGNVVIQKDQNGNIKPDKGKSIKKIDGVAALVNARKMKLLLNSSDAEEGRSIYDDDSVDLIIL